MAHINRRAPNERYVELTSSHNTQGVGFGISILCLGISCVGGPGRDVFLLVAHQINSAYPYSS